MTDFSDEEKRRIQAGRDAEDTERRRILAIIDVAPGNRFINRDWLIRAINKQ